MHSVENEHDEQCLPLIKLMSNKLDTNAIEIDKFVCPTCEPISACLNLVTCDKRSENENWFYPFSSMTNFGENIMITGGINTQTEMSTNECAIVKFVQDGRNFNFKKDIYTSEMNKSRHAHGTFYYDVEKTIFAIGGAQKIKENEIDYLESIENISILDDSANYDGSGDWQSCSFKLKRARCSFSQLRVGNKLIVFGGFSGIDKIENSLEIIDFEKKEVVLVEFENAYSAPIYPILLLHSKNEILVLGGFTKTGNQNTKSFLVNFDNGNSKINQIKGLQVTDKLHAIKAFNDTFIFGGNCFDKSIPINEARFKSLNSNLEGPVLGGFKDLKQSSIDSIKHLLDCFASGQFDFLVEKN